MDETEDTSVYFTDGHVVSKKLILIAAKLNALSEEEFSRVFYLKDGEWTFDDLQDSVHSGWFVNAERTAYWLGRRGNVIVVGGGRLRTEKIPDAREYGFLNRMRQIGSDLYICGYGGQVYRRTARGWDHLDSGILVRRPTAKSVDLQDIDGTAGDDIYAVGTGGALFHFDGKRWTRLDSPTNLHLLRVRCVSKDEVYICGSRGCFFKGNRSRWNDLSDPNFTDDFWGLEYFQDEVYLAHANGLMVWTDSTLKAVNLGVKKPISAHRLHANDGVLWSFGVDDLFSYDGKKWKEVPCPENED